MRRFVLDSNAVDPIADTSGAYAVVRAAVDEGRIEVLFTHITLDELARTPDVARRQFLLVVLVSLGKMVATSGFVFSQSRFGQAGFGDQGTLEALVAGRERNTRDALIGATAAFESCILVTADRELSENARAQGIDVMGPPELLRQLGVAI